MVCRDNPLAYLIRYFKTVISLVGPRGRLRAHSRRAERSGVLGGTESCAGGLSRDNGTSSHSDQSVKKGDQVLPQEIMD